MKHFVIVSGGKIEEEFALQWITDQNPDVIIAADAGMEFLYRCQINPDMLIGDFDSVNKDILAYYSTHTDVEMHCLNPIKDDTDTEAAIRLSLERGAEAITLLGATGTRLDHVFGNVELLGIGMKTGVSITILDAHNRIRMIKKGISLKKEQQYGTYVSLLPFTEQVEHVYLKGFKYPLTDACLQKFCSIGISNEILAEEAFIEFDGGILLIIESKD